MKEGWVIEINILFKLGPSLLRLKNLKFSRDRYDQMTSFKKTAKLKVMEHCCFVTIFDVLRSRHKTATQFYSSFPD